MFKSILCDYSDTYILVEGTVTVLSTAVADPATDSNKKLTFKNCVPFSDCLSEINNTRADNAKDIAAVMPMYNLIEYSDVYSKISRSLW